MQTRNFTNIEQRVSPVIHEVANECLQTNLQKEIQLVWGDRRDDNDLLLFDLWKDGTLLDNLLPEADFLTEVSWQGRSSGRTQNSLSGHALLVGGKTRLPCCMSIKSKKCNCCMLWNCHHGVDEDIPEHD